MKHGDNHNNRSWIFTTLFLLFLVILGLSAFLLSLAPPRTLVTFLDVGQGDAIFIEAPNGTQVLVDAGPDAGVVGELSHVMPFWDRTIDMVVPSHADKDHIGGFPEVFERFQIKTVYDTSNTATTSIYEAYEIMRDDEGADVVRASFQDVIVLDQEEGVYLRVLFPDQETESLERNDASTILQLIHGESSFLLTGDAGVMIEEYLVHQYGDTLQSEVLKAGHHGSKTSSSSLFVKTVDPDFVVISAGKDNSYGHPHAEVIETFKNSGATIFETQYGAVTFVTDGKEIWKK